MKRSTQLFGLVLAAAALLSGCNDKQKNDSKVLNERVIEGEGKIKVIGEI